MTITRLTIATLTALTTTLMSPVHAATLAQHVDDKDPLTEGWSLSSNSSASFQGGTETIGLDSTKYWETKDTSASGFSAYVITLQDSIRDNPWSLSAIVRVVSSPQAFGGTTAGGQSVSLFDGLTVWQFNFRDDRAGPVGPFPFNHVSPAVLDTRTTYRSYRIEFLPNQAGTNDDTANFFVDGTLAIANVSRSQLAGTTGTPQLLFGNASSPGLSTARYSSVVLSAVPEVGTGLLSVLGTAFLILLATCRARFATKA